MSIREVIIGTIVGNQTGRIFVAKSVGRIAKPVRNQTRMMVASSIRGVLEFSTNQTSRIFMAKSIW